MATLASRRERRAAWRALRPFMEGGAIAVRSQAWQKAQAEVAAATTAKGKHLYPHYCDALDAAMADPARLKHAARTAQWRAMWTDPKAGFAARP